MVPDLISDFWWLPKNVPAADLLIGVGHHNEVADSEEVPPLNSWYRSLDQEACLSNKIQYYSIDFLSMWRSACKNTNVYRTLKVFDRNTGEAIFLGPFLIDIDNSESDNSYREDLNDAQAVTNQVVTHLIEHLELSSEDLRIFFSGRKGFNVEVRPEILGINGSVSDQIKLSKGKLDDIIAVLRNNNNIRDSYKDIVDSKGAVIARCHTTGQNIVSSQGTVIDLIYNKKQGYEPGHPYIRLHDSINKWIRGDGKAAARRKIEITYKQLREKSATEISSESEALAQTP